jgi:Mn2+/Fe2+ NRAMP family transporter
MLRWAALGEPGLLVMRADCDAGNVVTAAQAILNGAFVSCWS